MSLDDNAYPSKGERKTTGLQKFIAHSKTVIITSLVFISLGMYVWVHAESDSHKKTIEVKDKQIQNLQAQLDQALNLK